MFSPGVISAQEQLPCASGEVRRVLLSPWCDFSSSVTVHGSRALYFILDGLSKSVRKPCFEITGNPFHFTVVYEKKIVGSDLKLI